MGLSYNMGNVEHAAAIEGLAQGLEGAAKSLYTIQQARRTMDMKQQQIDNETDYKHAQIDYLEGRGDLMSSQADAARFNVNRAKKLSTGAFDAAQEHIDNAQQQTTAQAGQYRDLLNKAIQTPQGQDYLRNKMAMTNQDNGETDPSVQEQGSPVVNNIMPQVGAQNVPSSGPLANGYAPVGNAQNMKALETTGVPGKTGKRNATLQRALGHINSMQIDNREDAQYALEKYYGADWKTNPDAINFLDTKFGKPGASGGASGLPAQGEAAAATSGQAQGDMVSVTAPDGTPYKLPKANLQKALQRGYKVRGQ